MMYKTIAGLESGIREAIIAATRHYNKHYNKKSPSAIRNAAFKKMIKELDPLEAIYSIITVDHLFNKFGPLKGVEPIEAYRTNAKPYDGPVKELRGREGLSAGEMNVLLDVEKGCEMFSDIVKEWRWVTVQRLEVVEYDLDENGNRMLAAPNPHGWSKRFKDTPVRWLYKLLLDNEVTLNRSLDEYKEKAYSLYDLDNEPKLYLNLNTDYIGPITGTDIVVYQNPGFEMIGSTTTVYETKRPEPKVLLIEHAPRGKRC